MRRDSPSGRRPYPQAVQFGRPRYGAERYRRPAKRCRRPSPIRSADRPAEAAAAFLAIACGVPHVDEIAVGVRHGKTEALVEPPRALVDWQDTQADRLAGRACRRDQAFDDCRADAALLERRHKQKPLEILGIGAMIDSEIPGCDPVDDDD